MTETRNNTISIASISKIAGVFLMLALMLKLFAIFSPAVDWDTNYYLNIALNQIEFGGLTPYMWRIDPDANIIAGSGTGYAILLTKLWFQQFGISVISGRILMYIVGLFILVTVFFVARSLWKSTVAGIIAIVFAAVTGIFIEIYYVRMDALGILSYSLVLLLHFYAIRHQKTWLHFLVGVLSIASAEFHILAIIWVVALSFYYGITYLLKIRQKKSLFVFTPAIFYFTGALVAGIVYLFIHVIPDPEAYFLISSSCTICTPPSIGKEVSRILMIIFNYPVELLLFSIALGISIRRFSEPDKHILLLFVGYSIGQTIISPPLFMIYTTHSLLLFVLIVSGIFYTEKQSDDYQDSLPTGLQLTVGSVAILFVLTIQFMNVLIGYENPPIIPESINYVIEYIPTDIVVMGRADIYYHLLEYEQYIEFRGSDYAIALNDEDIFSFWEREQPLVMIETFTDEDSEWLSYMHSNDFQQVREDVWIDGNYYESLIEGNSLPEMSIRVSENIIQFNDCSFLEWDFVDTDRAFLNSEEIPLSGSREICPLTDRTYEFFAYWVGGIGTESITIIVQ